ncbi:protein CASPARIAN STRIP INTEGRITY FACTOR 1-like isoform X2 [Primulina tabacum]|uniref:protein CASPARIAN STRIP INTEGRITY FACTOR 1-like isoform X2 n=1 Tax=Primulina tabacum TaxID=48773 RepID=UPI003F59D5A4
MKIILIKKISLLLLLLSAALFSTSLAGRLRKSGESKKVSTTDDEEMKSWGQLRKERILKVKTNDYGKYDPAPALVKPPFKLIPN